MSNSYKYDSSSVKDGVCWHGEWYVCLKRDIGVLILKKSAYIYRRSSLTCCSLHFSIDQETSHVDYYYRLFFKSITCLFVSRFTETT